MEYEGIFKCKYDILCDEEKKFFGEKDKKKRICRFCKRSYPKVKFTHKAHAISEALGNSSVFCNEECDECNEYFGNNIEPSLISFFEFHRLFFNSSSKKSTKTLKNKAIKCTRTDSGIEISLNETFKGSYPLLQITPDGARIRIEHQQKFVAQKAYKALCKFAICFLDQEDLVLVEDTIAWICDNKFSLSPFQPGQILTFNIPPFIYPRLQIFTVTCESFPNSKAIVCNFFFLTTLLSFRVPFLKNDLPILAYPGYHLYTLNNIPMLHFLLEQKSIDFSSQNPVPLKTILQSY